MENVMDWMDIHTLIALGRSVAVIAVALAAAKLVQMLLIRLAQASRLFHTRLNEALIRYTRLPLTWLLTSLAFYAALPLTALPETWVQNAHAALKPLCIAMFGWLISGIVNGSGQWLQTRFDDAEKPNSLGVRRFRTQMRILTRVAVAVVIILTVIAMALVIPALREFGMSLFASAGVAGIVLGIAANTTLSNFIAGVQLALTQQILLGDSVIVDNESGTIEEITSSYVVLRTWDLRRLIIPLRYFMENPFQNWTYRDPALIGTVFIYTDYTADVAAIRAEAEHLIKTSPLWDGKVVSLQVTESEKDTLQLRILASGKDAPTTFNLRCEIREKIIAYLQKQQPHALPRSRVDVEAMAQPPASGKTAHA